jgi:lipopolysaccharide export system permease protein
VIISRYILKEVLFTLIAVVTVLLLIFLSNRFVYYLADASTGALSSDVILTILMLKTLDALVIMLPLALFLSVLIAFSRLYKDSEMVAMLACGVSIGRIYKTVLLLSVLVALVVSLITFYIAPWATEQTYRIQDREKAAATVAGIASGRFTTPSSSEGVFYAEHISDDQTELQDVFIHSEREGQQVILSAAYGRHFVKESSGDRYLELQEGYRYEGLPGSSDFTITKFKTHAIRIQEQEVVRSNRKHKAYPTRELLDPEARRQFAIDHQRNYEDLRRYDAAELHWRLAMPLSTILLALLAVPLSKTNPRQGRYAKLFVAILVYFIYSNLMGVGRTWIERDVIAQVVGLWWTHSGILLLTGVLLYKQYGLSWFRTEQRGTTKRLIAGKGQ